jgi:cytochrome c553
VGPLDDGQMADVAVHMARLSIGASDARIGRAGDEQIVTLVDLGDPKRGLPACSSCHSVNSGGPIETPVISGQREEYIFAQLRAFARGARSNDVYRRMRSVASKLTDAEMLLLARFYARAR